MELQRNEILETENWFKNPQFKNIIRLHSAEQVVAQRGTIPSTYSIAERAAEDFYKLLRELFSQKEQITTFGPYSPGQAVTIKRMGIEAIYLGGWATSAKGSFSEDPGPDLASYPLSQVPEEAASLVRALLCADKNQRFARSKMSKEELESIPEIDYRPFIIADADTGHGGESHVRNLIRRFVEVGVPGYHIEDQKPGVKKCGHQAGKVLVSHDEQIKRLNSARFQLDIMKVPGIIVARTDAESATYLDNRGDERDHPFILGATNVDIPSYRVAYLSILKNFYERGIKKLNGHLVYLISDEAYNKANSWLEKVHINILIDQAVEQLKSKNPPIIDKVLDKVINKFLDIWQMEAGMKTYGQTVADVMKFHIDEGEKFELTIEEWLKFVNRVSYREAKEKAKSLGISIIWDYELPKTPEGYFQIQGGIKYAISRSLSAAPFADILWMETKTANLEDAKVFANAIHEKYPEKMLAYNLSPSFNWDTTGMTEEEMIKFPVELGKLGFVFNFITYGGHQIDGLAAEEFATALKEDGMLALARLQRKFRLLNSPYKTPQTYVGGPRSDDALMASTGRTATTKAMGKGSTQFQHLIQTEVPPKVLETWLKEWSLQYKNANDLHVKLRPHTAGSDLLSLTVSDSANSKIANIIFSSIQDRRNRTFLSIRDQNTFDEKFRKKRLMTLVHLFLIHRYKSTSVHYVTPTELNKIQAERMKDLGIYYEVNTEVGEIIVAIVNLDFVKELLNPDQVELKKLISKS
jgi:isocitrate lyase